MLTMAALFFKMPNPVARQLLSSEGTLLGCHAKDLPRMTSMGIRQSIPPMGKLVIERWGLSAPVLV